jgi:hypothetical protein
VARFALYLAVAAFAFLLAGAARAAGAVLAPAGESVQVVDVRYAIAMSRERTTRWVSLRLARVPGAMAWVLPVRSDAAIAEVGDAWLDALESATAPRIVAPACSDAGSPPPKVVVERRAPLAPSVPSLHQAVVTDVAALREFADQWGFALPDETAARVEEITARGFALLVLVYGGPTDATATRTVRISDDVVPAVPLFLTSAGDAPLSITTYVVADTRTRLGPGEELEVGGTNLAVTQDGATNYAAALRAALLASRGESWAVESAGRELLFDGVRGPSGAAWSPGVAPTYANLAAQSDRTDVSDLDRALSGIDRTAAWLTRASGVVRPHTYGDDLPLTRRDPAFQSPFVAASAGPACTAPEGGVGPGGRPTNPGGPPTGTDPRPEPPAPDPTVPSSPPYRPYPPSTQSVGVACACAPGGPASNPPPSDESCDGADPADPPPPDADDCDGSADDGYAEDESCAGSSSSGYDDGEDCASSSSSGSSSSEDCSSSSGDDGEDGCSSGSSSSSDECSTARPARAKHARSKTRLSPVVMGLAAIALVARRWSRQRRASCSGPICGLGQ